MSGSPEFSGIPNLISGNPGLISGNPGLISGNPGLISGNPGLISGNPGLDGLISNGGGGYNPGTNGDGYNPGNSCGGGGSSCGGGGYNPGTDGDGYNPGNSCGGGSCGGGGYNPGNAGGSGYFPGLPINNGGSGYNPGNSCGMADNCCAAANEGCCIGGQQCYYIYEKKCKYENKPYCNTLSKQMCAKYQVRGCATAIKKEYIEVPYVKCKKKTEKKCWDYTRNVCDRNERGVEGNVTWTDEELVNRGDKTEEKCHQVSTCRLVDDSREVTQQVPEMKCESIPSQRKECRSVPVPQPPQEITKTVMDISYRESCYNVPRTKCTKVGCSSSSGCPSPGQNVCSTTEFTTEDVCNQCGSDQCKDQACQQVRVPVCYGGGGGYNGGCNAGPQECCRTEYERVCQQIPVKVPRQVTVTVQPPPQYVQRCYVVTENKQQCRQVLVPKVTQVPFQRCEMESENKCFKYQVPDQEVIRQDKSQAITVNTFTCNTRTETHQHCATLDVGVDCEESTFRKAVDVRYNKCDRVQTRTHCYDVPYSNCENSGGQSCEMVPRKVCQDTCKNASKRCNECSSFVSGGGFSGCGNSQCSNYIPRDAASGNLDIGY